MGFISSATTLTLTAKFTPFGREQLLSNSSSIISHFSLGDSDSNYYVSNPLSSGDVPNSSGSLTNGLGSSNSVTTNYLLKNKIIVNKSGVVYKPIEIGSDSVISSEKKLGLSTITADTRIFKINTLDNGNSLNNLLNSFGLPITTIQKNYYTTLNDINRGFSDTAIKNLNQDNLLVISINNDKFGEMIDGRVLSLNLTTSANTFNIYSTYQKSLTQLEIQDNNSSEISSKTSVIGNNIVFLFSDEIQPPNSAITKSWATGFNKLKPFSLNGKELFNYVSNTSNNIIVDKCVGVAYLDKGIIVISEPTIVNSYVNEIPTITFDSLVNEVSQNITCVINRGEFYRSTNPTFSVGDVIRFSEVGLHDLSGNLMAIAKTDRHVLLNSNQMMALSINIVV